MYIYIYILKNAIYIIYLRRNNQKSATVKRYVQINKTYGISLFLTTESYDKSMFVCKSMLHNSVAKNK